MRATIVAGWGRNYYHGEPSSSGGTGRFRPLRRHQVSEEVDDGMRLVSFMDCDLGHVDVEQRTLQPLDNPFGPVTHVLVSALE
jgi:hypothetical protein